MDARSDPFETMADLRRRLYRVLEARLPQGTTAPAVFSPALDIAGGPDGVTVTVELPGVAREDIKVELEGQVLTISGQRQPRRPETADGVLRQERPLGHFSRSLALPRGYDREINASLKDGILTIIIPKNG